MNGHYPPWKTALRPVDGMTLIEEGKNKLAQCAELHAVFLVVLEELSSGKSPYMWVFTDSWAVASGLETCSSWRAMETWPTRGVPIRAMTLREFGRR